jgi:hypothetical protein
MPPADAAWRQKLAALRAHVAAHGRLPPQSHPSGLGSGISQQRMVKKVAAAGRKSKCGTMAAARAAALEAVSGWAWEVDAEAWQQRLDVLRAFVDAHGRLPPYKDAAGLGA